ncbi:MAG: hypothetical protein WCC27_04255 [Acidobacteriaceae bacterium]
MASRLLFIRIFEMPVKFLDRFGGKAVHGFPLVARSGMVASVPLRFFGTKNSEFTATETLCSGVHEERIGTSNTHDAHQNEKSRPLDWGPLTNQFVKPRASRVVGEPGNIFQEATYELQAISIR